MKLCDGTDYDLPLFDPIVATHIQASHSLVDTLIHQINIEKIYERFFEGKKNLTFLDIGANIGLVSIYSSPACDRVLAFEPAPDTYKVLESLTLPFDQIETVPFALATVDDTIDFYLNDINSTASSTVNTYGTRTRVDGMRLSSMLRIYQLESVDICKVDAEGGEGESLTADQIAIASPVVKTWYIETHNCPKSTWNQKMAEIVHHLTRNGYEKIEINGMAIIASK
jgi:FkbM family methyltransferase